jgi:hypothetical protein
MCPDPGRGGVFCRDTLQRHNTENSKKIFPEKELRGHSPNFRIHVSVSDLYIPNIWKLGLRLRNSFSGNT